MVEAAVLDNDDSDSLPESCGLSELFAHMVKDIVEEDRDKPPEELAKAASDFCARVRDSRRHTPSDASKGADCGNRTVSEPVLDKSSSIEVPVGECASRQARGDGGLSCSQVELIRRRHAEARRKRDLKCFSKAVEGMVDRLGTSPEPIFQAINFHNCPRLDSGGDSKGNMGPPQWLEGGRKGPSGPQGTGDGTAGDSGWGTGYSS